MKQITFLNSSCRTPSWSPNGKKIVFFSGSKIYTISPEGGTPSVLIDQDAGYSVYWESNSEIFYNKQGNQNFYIFNPVTRESRLFVSNDTVGWMFFPRLSPDDSNIAIFWNRTRDVINDISYGIWIISLKDLSQRFLIKDFISPLKWSEDGKWIYAIHSRKIPADILKINAITGLSKIIYTFPPSEVNSYNIDITSDGEIIVCTLEESNSDVWMIENFDSDVE